MRSMPWPRPFGATKSPRSIRQVTWPEPGPDRVLGLAEAKQGQAPRDEDDGPRRRLVDDPDRAERDLREERPVGAREALQVLGLPHLAVDVGGHLDLASWIDLTAPVVVIGPVSGSGRVRVTLVAGVSGHGVMAVPSLKPGRSRLPVSRSSYRSALITAPARIANERR